MTHPFSFDEIQKAHASIKQIKPSFFPASDNLQLAYHAFIPKDIKGVVVFYHAAGMWSMPIYQLMAEETMQRFSMAVYLVDIRGHGHSQGTRGDASNHQTVWNDVNTIVNFIKNKHPNVFLLLAGHSAGAGMILNYLYHSRDNQADGCVLLAPFVGADVGANIKHKNRENSVILKVKFLKEFEYNLTRKRFFAHIPTFYFNYGKLFELDPLILKAYTCAMRTAIFPKKTKKILRHMTKPCALFIGQEDEQFNAHKILALQKCFQNTKSTARIISKANHFSIISKAPALFEEAWQNFFHQASELQLTEPDTHPI